MSADIASVVSLLAAGVLTGNELGTWAVVHPAMRRLGFAREVAAEQQLTRRYGFFMPGLMVATVAAAFVSAGLLDGSARVLASLAGACYLAMLAITLTGNIPINVWTLRFDGGDERAWRARRSRWDRLHTLRIVLDVGGFMLVAAAAVTAD